MSLRLKVNLIINRILRFLTCEIHGALPPAQDLEAKELYNGGCWEGGIVGVEGDAGFIISSARLVDPGPVRVGKNFGILDRFRQLRWVALDSDC